MTTETVSFKDWDGIENDVVLAHIVRVQVFSDRAVVYTSDRSLVYVDIDTAQLIYQRLNQ